MFEKVFKTIKLEDIPQESETVVLAYDDFTDTKFIVAKMTVAEFKQLEAKAQELDRREKGCCITPKTHPFLEDWIEGAYCDNCGVEIVRQSKYCPSCGTKLIWESEGE